MYKISALLGSRVASSAHFEVACNGAMANRHTVVENDGGGLGITPSLGDTAQSVGRPCIRVSTCAREHEAAAVKQ